MRTLRLHLSTLSYRLNSMSRQSTQSRLFSLSSGNAVMSRSDMLTPPPFAYSKTLGKSPDKAEKTSLTPQTAKDSSVRLPACPTGFLCRIPKKPARAAGHLARAQTTAIRPSDSPARPPKLTDIRLGRLLRIQKATGGGIGRSVRAQKATGGDLGRSVRSQKVTGGHLGRSVRSQKPTGGDLGRSVRIQKATGGGFGRLFRSQRVSGKALGRCSITQTAHSRLNIKTRRIP